MTRDLPFACLSVTFLTIILGLAQADKYSDLEQWVIDNGGWVNTTIRTRENGVRGLFMKVDAVSGAHVATITAATMINAGSLTSSILAGTLTVLRELKDPHSRFKPYIEVWPKPDEVVNVCNFPQKYLHMLPDHWQKMANVTQDYLHAALKGEINQDLEYTVKETVGNGHVSIEDLQYACALSSTRYVTEEKRKRLMMIPIFDMENHARDCPHSITSLDAGETVSIVLGSDVQAGDELCYPYTDTMRDDYGVMNYGFLPDLEDPPRLLEVDHHEFKPDADMQELSETPFTGDAEAVSAEIARHQQTLDSLALLDGVRPPGPDPGQDWVYDMLAELQRRRKLAITHEITRLETALKDMDMEGT